jgi:hypothetical protein
VSPIMDFQRVSVAGVEENEMTNHYSPRWLSILPKLASPVSSNPPSAVERPVH